jgi:flavin-dependent dehydrogenase
MKELNSFDVIIVGGGPAGSSAALRLLALGYRVALIEKYALPREQIGESLSPGIRNIFNFLDADRLLDDCSYLSGLPLRIIWEEKAPQFIASQHRGPGLMVNRGKLDAALIKLAVERGLHLFNPANFESCKRLDTNWFVTIKENNILKELSGAFILDARGRAGVKNCDRILTAPPSVALWVHTPAGIMPFETIVETLEEGWLWGAPLPNKQYRIMAFLRPELLKRRLPGIVFSECLSKAKLFKPALKREILQEIRTCLVLTYAHISPWQDHYIRLGEAAFTLDPLSSAGVEKAMRLSLQAVIAVNTLLKTGKSEVAKNFYEERVCEAIVFHQFWTNTFYAHSWPGHEHLFWKERSGIFPDSGNGGSPFIRNLLARIEKTRESGFDEKVNKAGPQADLFTLWNERIELSAGLKIVEAPCVVGDFVELKRAIYHPGLKREFAYLEQTEVVPLLEVIESAKTLGELVFAWSNHMAFEKAVRIAAYFISREILCHSERD